MNYVTAREEAYRKQGRQLASTSSQSARLASSTRHSLSAPPARARRSTSRLATPHTPLTHPLSPSNNTTQSVWRTVPVASSPFRHSSTYRARRRFSSSSFSSSCVRHTSTHTHNSTSSSRIACVASPRRCGGTTPFPNHCTSSSRKRAKASTNSAEKEEA